MERNISSKIEFSKLNNTRDLGGMKTKDGSVIRKGRLFRSGQLYFADENDREKIKNLNLRKIFDFRSIKERTEKPDPEIQNVDNIHLPIVRDITAGITRDQKSDGAAFDLILKRSAENPEYGLWYMMDTYRKMVVDDYALSQYAFFLNEISELESGAALWHCTAGKDRAGFATVLILEILGTHPDDIMEDYLSTNQHLEGEIEQLVRMLTTKIPEFHGAEHIIRDFFGAKEEYLSANYKIIKETYGGMDAFIRQAVHVDDAKKQKIRNLYLN